MPVDQVALRRIVDDTERVTEAIRVLSVRLGKLDPCKSVETSARCAEWTRNVNGLKETIEGLLGQSRAMRESARIQDEQQGEHFRDRYRFLLERLKTDIRFFFGLLKDGVDVPQDFNRQRSWNDHFYDMEMELKSLSAVNAGEHRLTNVDPLVSLLNLRDRVLDILFRGILFQKAVLDWDLKVERAFADGPMVEMAENVVEHYSKTDCVPARYGLADMPRVGETGTFTYQTGARPVRQRMMTDFQRRSLAVLNETLSQDAQLRSLRFAERVYTDPRKGNVGTDSPVDELKAEYARWSDRANGLDRQLAHSRKSKGNAGLELKAEQLLKKLGRQEQLIKEQVTQIHKLEGEWQSMKYELITLRRERNELQEKNMRMAKEDMPVLERMKSMVNKSQEAVGRLASDTTVLSQVFKLQTVEIEKLSRERDKIKGEVDQISRALETECGRRLSKEHEVKSTETMYLRTMAARKCISADCDEQRHYIDNQERERGRLDEEIESMRRKTEQQDAEMERASKELARSMRRIDELQTQQNACMRRFEDLTGKPGPTLLRRFAVVPTLPSISAK